MDTTCDCLRLPRDERASSTARRWLERIAAQLPEKMRSDVFLLTHELVINAVRHSDGDFLWVSAEILRGAVRVKVTDEGGFSEPAMLPELPYSTSGRGLRWVAALSDGWGVEHGQGRSVWFQIDRQPDDGAPAKAS